MDKQRKSWLLRNILIMASVLLALALFGVWNAQLQPVSGYALEEFPAATAPAQTKSPKAAISSTANPSAPTATIILPGALQVEKSYTPGSVAASDTVTFIIALRNVSTTTFGITVTDQLAPELTIVCGSESVHPDGALPLCDAQQNAITYTAPITAQTAVTLTFQAGTRSTLRAGYRIHNTVWAYYGEHSITDSVAFVIDGPYHVYLPLIARRWPPIPYAPLLTATTSDLGGNYTVSWTYDNHPAVTTPTGYVLHESSDASFSAVTSYPLSGATFAYNFTNKPDGTYYYRVQGVNAYGPGLWSQVVAVTVSRMYYDDFTNPASGWHTGADQRYNFWDPGHLGWETVSYIDYRDDHYRFYIPFTRHAGGDVDTWWVWPAVAAPLPEAIQTLPDNYCIEARARFISHSGSGIIWWAHWGIVFGADESFTNLHTFQINDNRNRAVIQYPSYVYPGNNNIRYRAIYQDNWTNIELRLVDWENDGYQFHNIHSNPSYNTIRVVVRGGRVDSYVNGIFMVRHDFGSGLPRDKIGLIAGNWEVTPQELLVDYFRYEPNCAEAQQ
jgi:uncharacterized repeat protein (TIGR01451 family)